MNVVEAFGEKIAYEMLGESFDIITKYSSEMEHQHAMKIKSVREGKTFKNTKPPKQQHKLFYGSNKSENSYPNTNSKSYSNVVKTVKQHSNTEIYNNRIETKNFCSRLKGEFKKRVDQGV